MKIKLSPKQKEVIQKMREGWTIEHNGWNEIITNGMYQIKVRHETIRFLQGLRLIDAEYKLTEKVKTIEL